MPIDVPVSVEARIAEIAELRAASNAALQRRNSADVVALFTPDYVILPGSSGRPINADALRKALDRDFAGGDLLSIKRKPDAITISFNGTRAAETGKWETEWAKADGRMTITGVYQATWIGADKSWKLLNESFITLSCSGSAACKDVR
jgi:ketosteroid isomerase-like protein